MTFAIKYGLSGGFGGCDRMAPEILDFDSLDAAERYAWEQAVQEYESYGGMHGLTTQEEVMEEQGITDDDEGYQAYLEAMGSWLDYKVEEVKQSTP